MNSSDSAEELIKIYSKNYYLFLLKFTIKKIFSTHILTMLTYNSILEAALEKKFKSAYK